MTHQYTAEQWRNKVNPILEKCSKHRKDAVIKYKRSFWYKELHRYNHNKNYNRRIFDPAKVPDELSYDTQQMEDFEKLRKTKEDIEKDHYHIMEKKVPGQPITGFYIDDLWVPRKVPSEGYCDYGGFQFG
ncbi:hypothetical protein B7494_g8517 [Chlorociboria aeruginascens]|nr:hypothetical protein B7494_g8517 [Chlorociboria aeruginascens]